MIARAHHLQDGQLFDCYVAERSGEQMDPRLAEHLTDCRACNARYVDLSGCMDTVRTEADAESDDIFTPERLRVQQQRIARRIGLLGRAAQVIEFPGRFAGRHITSSTARGVTRWVYGAAAAGLVIGVGLGAFYDSEWRARGAIAVPHQSIAPRADVIVSTGGSAPGREASDEAFLSDLEVALDRPHTRELQPFDALTPHVREDKH